MARTKAGNEMELRIAEAASELFTTYGYEHTTISMIASKVGISNGHLNSYFPKKEDLNRFCFMRFFRTLNEKAEALSLPVEEPLCRFLLEKMLANYNVFCNSSMKTYRDHLLASIETQLSFFDNYYELFRETLTEAQITVKDLSIREGQAMGLAAEYARIRCLGTPITTEDFLKCEENCAQISFSHMGLSYQDPFLRAQDQFIQLGPDQVLRKVLAPHMLPPGNTGSYPEGI